jgi:hypothetical protein
MLIEPSRTQISYIALVRMLKDLDEDTKEMPNAATICSTDSCGGAPEALGDAKLSRWVYVRMEHAPLERASGHGHKVMPNNGCHVDTVVFYNWNPNLPFEYVGA